MSAAFDARSIRQMPVPVSAANTATATHAATTITLPAPNVNHVNRVDAVAYSYSGGTPSGGSLTIQEGSTTVFQMDITAAGPGFLDLKGIINATSNTSLVFTLADGGVGIVGKLNLLGALTMRSPDIYLQPSSSNIAAII